MNRFIVLASCLALLGACKKKDESPQGDGGDKPAAAAAGKAGVGINAPGNDAKIVELAKKALGCKWTGKDTNPFAAFEDACPEYKAWKDEKEAFAAKKGEPTLVAFIEDPDDKVRYLGERRLADDLDLLSDAALAARVLTVAEKATSSRDLYPLGTIAGHTVLADAALWPRVKAMFAASKDINMRNAIITDLLPSNPGNEDVLKWTREVMKDTAADKQVARTAMNAFVKWKTEKPAPRCEAFFENIENADVDHAGDAMQWLTQPKMHCEAQFDGVLKSIDARIKAKTATSVFFGMGLGNICDPKGKPKPAQVKTALGLAHKIAENKAIEAHVRVGSIEASVKCDPKGGKKYLAKFKKETDQELKDTVARLLKQK